MTRIHALELLALNALESNCTNQMQISLIKAKDGSHIINHKPG